MAACTMAGMLSESIDYTSVAWIIFAPRADVENRHGHSLILQGDRINITPQKHVGLDEVNILLIGLKHTIA